MLYLHSLSSLLIKIIIMLKSFCSIILFFITFSSTAQFYGWSKSIGGSGADTCAALTIDNQANLYILGSFSGTGEFRNDSISENLTSAGNDDIFLQKRTKKGKYLFSKKFGGKGIDRPSNMIYYKGSIYISGHIEDTVDFGIEKVAPKGKRTIFLAKMDTLGKCIWVKTIGDSALSRARSLAINKDGIYLSGEVSGKVDNLSLNNAMFIQKRDFNGSIIWTKTFGTKRNVVSNAIATDSLGNIYNVGALLGINVSFKPLPSTDSLLSSSFNTIADIFIQKLNANGELIWAKKAGATAADEANTIAIKGNEVFTAGYFNGTVDFDFSTAGATNLKSNGGRDIFVSKYDLDGKLIWVKQIGNTKDETARQLEIDKYKNIYLSGTFNNSAGTTTDFMGKPMGTSGSNDAFCIKFDTQGKIKVDKDGKFLAKQFAGSGSDVGTAIKADTMNNIFISGSYTGSISLNPVAKANTASGTNDIFIYKSLLFSESDNYFEPKSSENELLSFTLKAPDSTKIQINDVNITIQVPKGTNLTKLVAKFTNSDKSKVTVNGILQNSGVTVNNFSNKTVEYVVNAEDGTKKTYFVTINYCTSQYNKIYLSQEAYCPNQAINFSLSSQNYNLIKEKYWNFGNGKYFTQKDINSSVKNSYSTTGVYNVAVSYLNPECFNSLDTTSVQLSISDKLLPNSDFNLSKSTLCPNEPFSLNASSYNEVIYVWDMGDKTTYTGRTVNHAYKEEWDNSVKLTVTNACGNSTTTSKIIKVSKKATTDNNANANIYSSNVACIGEPVSFFANGIYQSIVWNFKDNSTNVSTSNPSHSFKVAGDYSVQARLTDYCGVDKTISKNITIKAFMPFTNIQPLTEQKLCPGERAYLYNNQYYSRIKNYTWILPNNEIVQGQTLEKIFGEGENKVYLKLTNYCGNDTILSTKINVIRNIPISINNFFTENQPTEFCPNEEFSIRYNSSGIKSYVWTGQGLVNQENGYTGFFKLSNYGEYTMQLKLTSFCGKDTTLMTKVKIVKNKPFKEQFSDYTFNRSYCPGEEIYFSKNNYSSDYKLEEYDYGDGKKGTSSSHTYAAFGDYIVKLKLTNFCNTDTTIQAKVKIAPVSISKDAYIYVSRNYNTEEVAYCKGDEIRLDVSSNQGGSYKSIVWDFGDGTELVDNSEPSHVFAKSGILTIKAMLTSYCGDTLTIFKKMNIRTDVGHKGYVDEDIPNAVCPGENANFSIYQNFKAVAWDFGDGTSSTKKSTTHSYSKTGMYTVTMKLTNNCNIDTLIKSTVDVRNDVTPDIDFNLAADEICPGEKIVFFQSADSRDYQISYDFGDNSKDYTIVDSIAKYNLVLVSHKFLTKGTYQLKVTAKNKCGLTDTDIETITVQDGMKLNAGSDIESEKITADTAIFLLESHGAEFTWNFGKNDIVKTDVGYIKHGFSSVGNKNISVFVKTACGDTATFYTQMTIHKLSTGDDVTSGIKDIQEARFTIYPNPNQGIFQISGLPIGSYKIMNLMGAEVYRFRVENTDIQTLNLEHLAKGVYQVASEDIKIIHNKIVITD